VSTPLYTMRTITSAFPVGHSQQDFHGAMGREQGPLSRSGSKQRGPTCVSFTTHSVNLVKWSSQGMLRMSCEAMNELFQPTVSGIIQHIGECTEPYSSPTLGLGKKFSPLCLETTIHPYPRMNPRIIYSIWNKQHMVISSAKLKEAWSLHFPIV
jgi:hypothetical protein